MVSASATGHSELSDLLRKLQQSQETQNQLLREFLDHLQPAAHNGTPGLDPRIDTCIKSRPTGPIEVEQSNDSDCPPNERLRKTYVAELYPNSVPVDYLARVSFYVLAQESESIGPTGLILSQHGLFSPSKSFDDVQRHTNTNWRYWRAIRIVETGGSHQRYVICSHGHFPNFLPTWELKRRCGNDFYHVDDIDCHFPLKLPADPITKQHHRGCTEIPYSFVPPIEVLENSTKTTGIRSTDWVKIYSSVGDIFSAPPDGRMPLPFERHQLRVKAADGTLWDYIRKLSILRDQFDNVNAKFFIVDLNLRAQRVWYLFGAKHLDRVVRDKMNANPHCTAVTPALEHEQNGFLVSPTLVRGSIGYMEEGQLQPSQSNRRLQLSARPWCRFIYLNGIAEIEQKDKIDWRLLIDDGRQASYLSEARAASLAEAFRLHLTCKESRSWKTTINMFDSTWHPFHITWHQQTTALTKENSTPMKQSWKKGNLYGSHIFVQEHAFTFVYFPHCHDNDIRDNPKNHAMGSDSEDQRFWTVLLLAPLSDTPWRHTLGHCCSAIILRVVSLGLRSAADSWDDMRSYFASLVEENVSILDLQSHDAMLFDDDSFSKSRQYFWAMNTLDVFIGQINSAINEWKGFWAARKDIIISACKLDVTSMNDIEGIRHVDEALEDVEREIFRLEEHQRRFYELREKIKALREGLFSASSVIEARASTRLGENIQLLTYVSIFYLPLSFCVALWSVNETYSQVSLAAATIIVGGTTYGVVANLETLGRVYRRSYRPMRDELLSRMAERSDKWAERATRFRSFQVERVPVKPSRWVMVWFVILELLSVMAEYLQVLFLPFRSFGVWFLGIWGMRSRQTGMEG